MADERLLREERRFSAIVLSHPSLTTAMELLNVLGPMGGTSNEIDGSSSTCVRFELLHSEALYPASIATAKSLRRGSHAGRALFAHESYVAVIDGATLGPVLVLAVPYRVLLRSVIERLKQQVQEPSVRYVRVDMAPAFEFLARPPAGFEVVAIRAQVDKDPNVGTVTLEGRDPLNSDTWGGLKGLEKQPTPYALTLKYTSSPKVSVRVRTDRIGRSSWYQSSEACLLPATQVLGSLTSQGMGRLTDSSPLTRQRAVGDHVEEEDVDL